LCQVGQCLALDRLPAVPGAAAAFDPANFQPLVAGRVAARSIGPAGMAAPTRRSPADRPRICSMN